MSAALRQTGDHLAATLAKATAPSLEQQLHDAEREHYLAQFIDNTNEYTRERDRWAKRIAEIKQQIEARDAE